LSIYLACTSDKGTAHVFSLFSSEGDLYELNPSIVQTDEEDQIEVRRDSIVSKIDKSLLKNKESKLKFFRKVLPKYFSSEWSFAQFKIEKFKDKFTQCGFIEEEKLVLISKDIKGKSKYFYKTYSFLPEDVV
jgi:WD repeat-containing protein 45